MKLDIYDREILRYLLNRSPVLITTNQISKDLDLSWNTTKTHLIKLEKQKLVLMSDVEVETDDPERIYRFWKVNR